MSETVLVLGVGNVLMRDDGLGPKIVELLRERGNCTGVELVDGGTSPFDVLSAYTGGGKLLVVDAVDGGEEPGAVYRATLQEIGPVRRGGFSLHEVGLVEALMFLELTGTRWDEVVVIGVEPESVSWGEELTETIARVLPKVVDLVEREAGVKIRPDPD